MAAVAANFFVRPFNVWTSPYIYVMESMCTKEAARKYSVLSLTWYGFSFDQFVNGLNYPSVWNIFIYLCFYTNLI